MTAAIRALDKLSAKNSTVPVAALSQMCSDEAYCRRLRWPRPPLHQLPGHGRRFIPKGAMESITREWSMWPDGSRPITAMAVLDRVQRGRAHAGKSGPDAAHVGLEQVL